MGMTRITPSFGRIVSVTCLLAALLTWFARGQSARPGYQVKETGTNYMDDLKFFVSGARLGGTNANGLLKISGSNLLWIVGTTTNTLGIGGSGGVTTNDMLALMWANGNTNWQAQAAAQTYSNFVAGAYLTLAGTNGLVQTGALTSAQWTWASITNATPRTTTTVNVLDFGASGSPESTTTIGTLTNGSDVVFVASTNTFAVGQTASIQGAGWSGNYHMGTITSMTATSITFTPVTYTTVTAGKIVRHDETAAIQAAINACTNGGTVFMPAGFYRVNSINYAAASGSGRIVLPTWGYSSTNQAYALRIVGEGSPAIGVTNGCTIIQTEQTLGYILSGKATTPPGGWSAATHLWLSLENLLFRTYENPQIGALNLEFVAGATLKDVVLDVGKNSTCGYNAACTLTNGYNTAGIGVAMPGSLNTSACSLRNVAIQGYYIGVKANGSEHLLLDKVYMTHCTQGLAVNAANHGIIANQLETEYCDYGIYITGAVGALDVRGWNTENTHVADLYDLTSQAFGVVSYSMLQGPIITGGTNLTLRNLRNGSNVVAGAQTFLGPVSGGGLVQTNMQPSWVKLHPLAWLAFGSVSNATLVSDTSSAANWAVPNPAAQFDPVTPQSAVQIFPDTIGYTGGTWTVTLGMDEPVAGTATTVWEFAAGTITNTPLPTTVTPQLIVTQAVSTVANSTVQIVAQWNPALPVNSTTNWWLWIRRNATNTFDTATSTNNIRAGSIRFP